ncbi:MAG: aa3-type cytochrome c oxidase subunit IV [Rhodospirillales bacterium]|jgi:hypothetical protein|nr:aa3-type cytochrome c oxidase subunit IV [Rhodospirillales bacterium]
MSDDQMLHEHQQTWRGFCKLLAWSIAGIVVTLALMGIFLVD